jgi:hypothetical protein
MADNWLDSNYQPRAPFATPGPVDQYAPLAPDQIAGPGMGGEPVPFPSVPGQRPAYPPQGQQTSGMEGAMPSMEGGGFPPRRPDESASQFFARKQAAGQEFTPGDFMALDAEQQALQASLGLSGGGGLSSTTTSTTRQNDSPELRQLREIRSRAVQQYGERMLQTASAAGEAGAAQAQMQATRADQLKEETAAAQQRQEAQTAELQRRQTEVEAASKDYVKAAQTIDPNRLMKGGRGILAALAMGAGASGATLGRTQNFAQQIIDSAINRDLSAQQMAVNAKKDALTQTQQSFQNYRAIYQDDAAARAAVRADAREIFAMQLDSVASKYRGQEQQANIMNMRDNLLLEQNRLRQEQAELAAGRVQTSVTTQSGVPAGGGSGDLMERMAKAAANAKAFNELSGAEGPTKADESHLNDVAKQAGIWVPVLRRLEKLDQVVAKTNWGDRATGWTQAGGDFEAADSQFRNAALQAITGAAFSKEQAEAFENMINKNVFTAKGYQHKIQQVQEFIAQEIQAKTATLHPTHQGTLRKRMIAGGIPEAVVNSAMTGTSISTRKQYGEEAGARSH